MNQDLSVCFFHQGALTFTFCKVKRNEETAVEGRRVFFLSVCMRIQFGKRALKNVKFAVPQIRNSNTHQ